MVYFKPCFPSLKVLLLTNYSQPGHQHTHTYTHTHILPEWGVSLEPDFPETVADPTYTCKFHSLVPGYTSPSVLEGIECA